jgi:hypothetical protein
MFLLFVTHLWNGHEFPDTWIWIGAVQSLKPGLLSEKDMTHSSEQILVGGALTLNEINPRLVRPIAMANQPGEISHMVLIGRQTTLGLDRSHSFAIARTVSSMKRAIISLPHLSHARMRCAQRSATDPRRSSGCIRPTGPVACRAADIRFSDKLCPEQSADPAFEGRARESEIPSHFRESKFTM